MFLARAVVAIGFLVAMAAVAWLYYIRYTGTPKNRTIPPPTTLFVPAEPAYTRPTTCPVTASSFCTLLGFPEGHTGCTFDSSWLNEACQMSCDAVLHTFVAVGELPGHFPTMGLLRPPSAKDQARFKDEAHNAACRLGEALMQHSLSSAEEHAEGLQNFYFSAGNCIRQRYFCG